jgi:hypothetical protein
VSSNNICWCDWKCCFIIISIICLFVLKCMFFKTAFMELVVSWISMVVTLFSISNMIDVIVVVTSFTTLFCILMLFMNMTSAPTTIEALLSSLIDSNVSLKRKQ